MFDKNYFLKRLQAGEDMSDIGAAIAEAMSEAQAEYDEAKRAEELKAAMAKKAEAEKAEKKSAIVKTITQAIADYAALEYPDLAAELTPSEEDVTALINSLDSIFGCVKMFTDMSIPLDIKPVTVSKKATLASDDEILENFLKKILG